METQPHAAPEDLRREAVRTLQKRRGFYRHALAYVLFNALLIVIWAVGGRGFFWPVFVLVGWGIGLAFNAFDVFAPNRLSEKEIRAEMERMERMDRQGRRG